MCRALALIFTCLLLGKMLYGTVECFPIFLCLCENVGRQDDFANFWHFHQWIESFFNSIEFLCLNKVNWVRKKTQFIGENVKNLQNHVVGRRFHNETKPQETFHCVLILLLTLIHATFIWFLDPMLIPWVDEWLAWRLMALHGNLLWLLMEIRKNLRLFIH